MGVAVALIAAIGWAALRGDPRGHVKAKCPDPIDLDGVQGFIFGTIGDAKCKVGKELRFDFRGQPRTRYYLDYSPFYTEAREFQILVNDKVVGESPLASTRRSTRQEVRIDDSLVKTDVNFITFRPAKPSEWGIERVELLSIPLDQSSAEKGAQAFELGSRLYQERNVAAPNLYNAFVQMRAAWRFMEGLEPKPADYVVVTHLLKTIENELDKLCNDELFAAKKEANYGHYEASGKHYKFIKAAFPGDEHPCAQRAQAQANAPEKVAGK